MDSDRINENYRHGNLLKAISEALVKMNLREKDVTVDLLSPVDEFHIGGRVATAHLVEQLNLSPGSTVLDLGCGLGGAARYVAHKFGCTIEGIDLCEEYIETGKSLNEWVNLEKKIKLVQGSASELPYSDGIFDGAYQIHVGMNIEDKSQLLAEVQRVLKPKAIFGIYDVMTTGEGELQYPVPWASDQAISHLATPEQYRTLLEGAGFEISVMEKRKDFALEFFEKMKARFQEMGGPPPLGLHTLMQTGTQTKLQNMIAGIAEGIVAPVEIVSKKL